MAQIQVIGVLGSGQMGGGIAQTAAQAGFDVYLADQTQAVAEKGKGKIEAQLRKLVEKGKMTDAETKPILDRIRPVAGLQEFKSCHLVIEAVSENPSLKNQIFRQLDELCPKDTLLASNTSSI